MIVTNPARGGSRALTGLKGILAAVQTPFLASGELDPESLGCLANDAIEAGADGLLAPVAASEVASLAPGERARIVAEIAAISQGRIPLIVGASGRDPAECRAAAEQAGAIGAAAYLVAVPPPLYRAPGEILSFFEQVTAGIDLPLIIQDLEFNGPGMELGLIRRLRDGLPTLAGMKIETVPAGPKYTQVRTACGQDFFIAGGWAVTQFIEALDRGVDAMVPESSMVRLYKRIQRLHQRGERKAAVAAFRQLLPILAFTNQEIAGSIAFFKKLLVRRGIFATATMRGRQPLWDPVSDSVAEDLIDLYFELESASEPFTNHEDDAGNHPNC